MKKITVILSGVGVYGYSGLALMEFFDRNYLKPNLIVGCSEGALIAALWAKGYSPKEALECITEVYHVSRKMKFDPITAMCFLSRPFGIETINHGILKVNKVQKLYHKIFQNQLIEHLPVQTIFQTTDITLGETHYLKRGLLADAVYASSAILPFYPPIQIEKKWLVDGVFSETLPLKIVLDEHSDLIIIMDPMMPTVSDENSFMFYYAQFVQKALKKAAGPRSALAYDLHHSEIVVVPVKMRHKWDNTSDSMLKQILDVSRKSISEKEVAIFGGMRG